MALAPGMEVTASKDTLKTAMKKVAGTFAIAASSTACSLWMHGKHAWHTCRVANMANLSTSFFWHSCRLLFSTSAAVHSGVLWPLAASIWVGSSLPSFLCSSCVCVVSSSLCYYCCYQPLMLCQLFINCLSTFYQLFINFFLSTFYQRFYQLFTNCLSTFLSTFYQLLSSFYQLGRNDHFWHLWNIVCIAARSYYVLGFTSCGRARVSAYSFLVSLCLLPRTSGRDAPLWWTSITAIV